MKRSKLNVFLAGVASLMTLFLIGYYFITADFYQNDLFLDVCPPERVLSYGKDPIKKESAVGTYLQEYLQKTNDLSHFPNKRNGIVRLKLLFIAIQCSIPDGDTSGEIDIPPDSPLYRRLSIYFPSLARESHYRISSRDVVKKIACEEPSRFRYFLFKVGLIKE